jgi:glutamate dehydrogenase
VHARSRGAETWWKSFTTGKSAQTLGGVPHDTYGMTSLSIRQYVLGIYKQLGLKEADITKVQTGGPDGDLGSSASWFLFLSLVCPFLSTGLDSS